MERSEKILQGLGNQYYRATLKSMGFTTEDLKRPVIGIANAWSECVPGHYNLRQVAQRVKDGIYRAGGTPIEFGVIGGCDGTRPSRRYYTDFAKLTPPDTVILTLACGKFRLNDLPLGTVAGLPRILDVGQCNDAYSAIQIALGLAGAFDCSVNELPLSIILCWFEQKAVCVLMALLALGIRGIRLGPTLPAFLSPGVAAVLQEKYDLRPITTPEDDLAACLGGS